MTDTQQPSDIRHPRPSSYFAVDPVQSWNDSTAPGTPISPLSPAGPLEGSRLMRDHSADESLPRRAFKLNMANRTFKADRLAVPTVTRTQSDWPDMQAYRRGSTASTATENSLEGPFTYNRPREESYASTRTFESDITLLDKDAIEQEKANRYNEIATLQKPKLYDIPRRNLSFIAERGLTSPKAETEYDFDFSDDEVLSEDEEDEEQPLHVPALEYIDPQIPQVEVPELAIPSVAVATQLPQHPWREPPFTITERPTPTIHPVRATIKITLSLAVVISLLVGYGLKLKIVTFGKFSFGMYGLLLTIDFIVQTIAASFNRRRVAKLTKKSPITQGVLQLKNQEIAPLANPPDLPEVSIAVVGYREDEDAWMKCLGSLRAQEYPIKHIIGVVDGNEGPDLDMANAFGKAFPEEDRLIVDLPVLLSVMYKEKYWETIGDLGYPAPTRWEYFKMWFTQAPRKGQEMAHEVAWNHTLDYLHTLSIAGERPWSSFKGVCFSQPHGHKRHAMFTSFIVGAYVLGTKGAMLTTDSDTYVHPDAVTNLMALLMSDVKMAGVTGDVQIWNKSDSFLALMSSLRYWFAFNVERACQSAFGCVGCLSGPLGLYKTADLMTVLGPWILQSFLGKETTFGDDRHLSNRILSLGYKTGYTALAKCDSDTPAGYVRWVKQQTRWSKSFFREAFWFPKSFAYHDAWLTVEMTKQFLYPMVLTATILHMLYKPTEWIRPVIWLGTMFGVALIKSTYGVICMGDLRHFLFGIYGFMYFFGLLPSKLFAGFTVGITTWGTSARSKSEFKRPESLYSRSTHIGHLVVWYLSLAIGLGYFLATVFHQPLFLALGGVGLFPVIHLYLDVITGEARYAFYVFRKWRKSHKAVPVDEEKAVKSMRQKKKRRAEIRRMLRFRRAGSPEAVEVIFKNPQMSMEEITPIPCQSSDRLSVSSENARPALDLPIIIIAPDTPFTNPFSGRSEVINTFNVERSQSESAADVRPSMMSTISDVPSEFFDERPSISTMRSSIDASPIVSLPTPSEERACYKSPLQSFPLEPVTRSASVPSAIKSFDAGEQSVAEKHKRSRIVKRLLPPRPLSALALRRRQMTIVN